MKRVTFDDSVNLPPHGRADYSPSRLSHRCAAQGCPMAGALADSSHATSWWCGWHFGCHATDIARITSVMHEHQELRDIVTAGRALLVSRDIDPREHAAEWKRLRELLTFAGYTQPTVPSGAIDTLAGWLYRVEHMLAELVNQALGVRKAA